jgi:hypothetical protein
MLTFSGDHCRTANWNGPTFSIVSDRRGKYRPGTPPPDRLVFPLWLYFVRRTDGLGRWTDGMVGNRVC